MPTVATIFKRARVVPRAARALAGCQPGPPGERAGVAQFQQLQRSDVAAEEHTGVRQHLLVVAEVEHQP